MREVRIVFNTLGRCSAWLVCVMIAASLCGCADTAAVQKAAPGESVVLGRVAAVYNGKPVENLQGMSISGSSFVLLKIGETDGKLINLPGEGAFAWALPPGEYMLIEFQYFTEGARRTLDLRAKFLVPDRPVSVYIGLLRVTYKHGAQAAGLEDDFDGAVAQLRQTRPDAPAEIVKSLLEPEEQLGNYSAVVGACDPRWAIKCEDYQYGVRPLDAGSLSYMRRS